MMQTSSNMRQIQEWSSFTEDGRVVIQISSSFVLICIWFYQLQHSFE